MYVWVEWSVLLVAVAASLSIVVTTLRLGISPMPSSSQARQVMLQMLPDRCDGTVYELGAGWGGLAFALARKYPQARIIAWEASWVPLLFLKARRALSSVKNLEIHGTDFRQADFTQVQLVTAYLFTGAMAQLEPLLLSQLPSGAQVVSLTFSFKQWPAAETRTVDDVYRSPVYRYLKA